MRTEELGRQLSPTAVARTQAGRVPAPKSGSRRPICVAGRAQALSLLAARAGPESLGAPFLGTGLVPAPAPGAQELQDS